MTMIRRNPRPTNSIFRAIPKTLFSSIGVRVGTGAIRSIAVNPHSQARQAPPRPHPEARVRKERRKRIDPTTFEKQYTGDELEFMNAMQRYKERTGKAFPTYGEVIKVAVSLGYLRPLPDDPVRITAKSEPAWSLSASCLPCRL